MAATSVSVVIAAYNAERTIEAAVASVARQTLLPLELLVVDDASTDGTAAAAGRAVAALPGGRVLRQPRNGGPAAARNAGVAAATGEWVAFLDGDDVWLPWKLERQTAAVARQPDVALWAGGSVRFATAAELARLLELPAPAVDDPRPVHLEEFVRHNPVATSTVLLRRSVFRACGGFDPGFRGPEDFDLWLRVSAVAPIWLGEAAVALYRFVPGSLSMDERRFLPQVLGVLAKAFAPGGALAAHAGWRATAESTQYWNASWMAFNRGDRRSAVGLLRGAYRLHREGGSRVARPWLRLLARYLVGRRLPDETA